MKRKGIKIKEYSPFQDSRATRRRKFLRGVALVLVLGALFGAGWWVTKSGIDWFTAPEEELPEVVIPSSVPLPPAAEPGEQEANLPEIDDAEFAAPLAAGGNWAVVQHDELIGGALGETVQRLQDSGVAYALVTLKDSTGNLYYNSRQSAAAGSTQTEGFDAANVAKAFSEAGIVPAAAISAYEDSLAPYNDRGMAIQLSGGNEYLWLNNSAASGGVPWLNPYSTGAQSYISAVIDEVLQLGYQAIVVEGLQFPSGYGLNQANLAATGTVTDEAEQLAKTALEWQNKVAAAGGQCWFSYESATLLGEETQLTGSTPFGFGVERIIAKVYNRGQGEDVLQAAAGSATQTVVLRGINGFETEISEEDIAVAMFLN